MRVLGENPAPPGLRIIGIVDEFFTMQGDGFFFQPPEGVVETRGGESEGVEGKPRRRYFVSDQWPGRYPAPICKCGPIAVPSDES